jgi:sugar O-acyltransferase (sialic acid O-acetyltransferase NeuD family)
MQTRLLLLIGAGGHAKVVVDAIRVYDADAQITVHDDNPTLRGRDILGIRIRTPIDWSGPDVSDFHVAIGDNIVRERFFKEGIARHLDVRAILHPRAIISTFAHLGVGIFVAANALIAPSAQIGNGTIVNHSAVVDHDCKVGDFAHLGPGSVLGGGVTVGRGSLVGAGAVILPGHTIGNCAIIGAGAVVTQNVPDGVTVVGVPAREHNS